jgi:hypothetical protein
MPLLCIQGMKFHRPASYKWFREKNREARMIPAALRAGEHLLASGAKNLSVAAEVDRQQSHKKQPGMESFWECDILIQSR